MFRRTRMMMWAGTASLALALSPAAIAQGQGKGNGNGNGGQPAAQGKSSQGNGKADRGKGNGNADRGKQGGQAKPERGNGNGNGRTYDNRASNRGGPPAKVERGNGNGNAKRDFANGNSNAQRNNGSSGNRVSDGRDRYVSNVSYGGLRDFYETRSQVIDGCPPGLAKKRNGCLPPGQAKQQYREYDPGFFRLFGVDRGGYYYDNGYLLRYRGDSLLGYLPLLGGALGVGNVWPSDYAPRQLPDYYSSYYGFDDPRGYRYADNAIYRVDPQTQVIQTVAALLTGDQFNVGSAMPQGYDVYNVPYDYRDRYYDTPQNNYRYADGQIYQVDPTTQLITAIIDMVL